MDNQFIIEKREKLTTDLKKLLINKLNLDISINDIPDDAILFGSGLNLDSIDALQLIVGVESDFKVTIPQDQPHILRSINTIVDYILQKENPNLSSHVATYDVENIKNVNKDYFSIRNEIGFINRNDLTILKVNGQNSLNSINFIVSSNLEFLQDNTMLSTLVLKDNGAILTDLELYFDSECYWFILEKSKSDVVKTLLLEQMKSCIVDDCGNLLSIIEIVGPNSVSLIENFFGADVIGMRPKMMVKCTFNNKEISIIRINSYGEFGYRVILDSTDVDLLFMQLQNVLNQNLHKCSLDVLDLIFVEAFTFSGNNFIPNDENPLQAGLQWMIDFRKEDFIGKNSLLKLQNEGVKYKLVPYKISIDSKLSVNDSVFFDEEEVGYIATSDFSYVVSCVVGVAYIKVQYAWPGVKLKLTKNNDDKFQVEIVSAPFFISKSYESDGS